MADPTVEDRSGDGSKLMVRKIKTDHYALTMMLPRPVKYSSNVSIGATLRGLAQLRDALDNYIEQETRSQLRGGRSK